MITYCMNVHPGETLQDQISSISNLATEISANFRATHAMPSQTPFGLGLRFSNTATSEFFQQPDAAQIISDICTQHALEPFTLNAFPFGVFHNTTVKEDVYRPTWTDSRRVTYTVHAARLLATLMPAHRVRGSVSTAPLSYKTFQEDLNPAVSHVIQALDALHKLHQETGKFIVLSMEPEPGCYPETTDETIAVIHRIQEVAGSTLSPYLGVCFDTAHLAVEFEDLAKSVRKFTQAGITIGKYQISAALEGADSPEARQALARYSEGTYLHQTIRLCPDGALNRFGDLPQALKSDIVSGATLRTHFHVPLFETGDGILRTTTRLLEQPDFLVAVRESGCTDFEVETYTWNVWRECAQNSADIQRGIVHELSVAHKLFNTLTP